MVMYYSKDSKGYRLRNAYEPKDYSFRREILQLIEEEAKKKTDNLPGVSDQIECARGGKINKHVFF